MFFWEGFFVGKVAQFFFFLDSFDLEKDSLATDGNRVKLLSVNEG